MADLIKSAFLYVVSEECFDKYFYEFDFFDVGCFKASLSKGLGLGIIAGSLLVKVPQILKIWANKSAEGINIFSVLLDLFAITCHMSYSFVSGFPFSAWGDNTFLALQTAIIAAFILFFGGRPGHAGLFCVLYTILCYMLMGGHTPIEYLWSMQGFNIPILVLGKASQFYTNYKNKSTGQLSAATCFLLFAGSLARIFTSIQETGDLMMILTYTASSTLNGAIVAQLLYYWNKPAPKKKQNGKQNKANNKAKTRSKKAD